MFAGTLSLTTWPILFFMLYINYMNRKKNHVFLNNVGLYSYDEVLLGCISGVHQAFSTLSYT